MRPIRSAIATAAAIVAACAILPGLRANLAAMADNFAFIASLTADERDRFAAPGAGEAVLPPKVRRGLALVRNAKLDDFHLTPGWREDPELAQRMTEAAWPVRLHDASHNLIGKPEEVPVVCTIVDVVRLSEDGGDAVVYARCP
jgi:hypothetical protein